MAVQLNPVQLQKSNQISSLMSIKLANIQKSIEIVNKDQKQNLPVENRKKIFVLAMTSGS